MKVHVVMAQPRHHQSVTVELPADAVLADALKAAAMVDTGQVNGYAIFGINAGLSTPLAEGDRVELLRPLQIDPKDARRRRASRPASS